jgi:hypothetical protein
MFIFKLERGDPNVEAEWDTFTAAVVCAKSEEDARLMHPRPGYKWVLSTPGWIMTRPDGQSEGDIGEWVHPDDVKITLLGKAASSAKPGIILTSFLAG